MAIWFSFICYIVVLLKVCVPARYTCQPALTEISLRKTTNSFACSFILLQLFFAIYSSCLEFVQCYYNTPANINGH